MTMMVRLLLVSLVSIGLVSPLAAQTAPRGVVVAQEARAARIGADVLARGGNAVDAAVAVGFAMAVTYPRAGNIGGGGFMLIHLAASGLTSAIDYRETAPAAATRDMFLDANGEADPKKSRDSALSIGVPGTVAGMAMALDRYGSGKFSLADLIAPAIVLARDGIPIEADVADSLPFWSERMRRWPASAKIFLNTDRLVQRDLAATLAAIARDGPDGFYKGRVAETLAAAIREAGGIMTTADLANYRAIERMPMRGIYRGHTILSMPPSSSGGVVLVEMLNILEGYHLGSLDAPARAHLLVEAMKRAYADRAVFLGDPEQVNAPLAQLTSKDYAATLRATIDPARATPGNAIRPVLAPRREGSNTTHFSVMDAAGNAVSNTYTLNFSYGLGMVAEGTGVLLNNELDDFAAKPGAPNAYGLTGGEANAPGPGKRPLSSMTPTIVLKDGKAVVVTGSPGGSRIINAVLQVIVNTLDLKMPIGDAVAAPRLHQQWIPEEVQAETAMPRDVVDGLIARGHRVMTIRPATSANSIAVAQDGAIVGAADMRTRGALAAGE